MSATGAQELRVERRTPTSRVTLPFAVVIVVAAATVPLWGSSNMMKTAVSFLTLLALAQMWNLLAGYAGLMSVGQQAFIGVGAYSLWFFSNDVGLNPYLAVPVAGLIAAIIAIPTAGLAFRLHGGYFAVGTWVIAEVFKLVVINTDELGGGSGVTVTAAGRIARDTREAANYWLALGVAVGAIVLVYLLLRSRRGLGLTAIRDNETGAESLGVDVFRSKLGVYLIAAFGCGITGAVIYLHLLRIQPEAAFSVNYSALMIFTVVIGGVGTIEGPIIGSVIFFTLQQLLSDYGSWYLILIGSVAALVVVWARRGIWGAVVRRWPVDLFPVRRRLCLETVCFPEDDSGQPGETAGQVPKSPVLQSEQT